jgi:type I restriction enzyme S subunit
MKDDNLATEYGEIPADWQVKQLRDVCVPNSGVQTGPFGSQLHQRDYQVSGTPIITVEHLGENRIVHQDLPLVSDTDRQRLSRYDMRMGDIIFSRVGSVDRRSLVREEENGWLFSGRCLRVRPNSEVVSPEYLSWFFGLPAFKEYIRAIAVGATMPSINTDILSGVQVILPPLPEQRAIAHILGSLDDKIELNRCMNHTLEAMAQVLFKSWFVDFDPVTAKSEGRAPFGMSNETASLFPAEFVDSEMGAIPIGWEVTTLGKVLDITKGHSYSSSELSDSDTALATLKSFNRGGGYRQDGLKPFTGKYKPEQVLNPGELVIACTDLTQNADVVGRPAIIPHQSQFKTLVASLDLWILRPNEPDLSVSFLYNLLRTDDYVNYIIGYASGTTVLHLSKDGIPNYQFVKPSTPVLRAFNIFAKPISDRLISLEIESRTLASIRNALLPRLLSGEVRVKGVERLGEIQ